MLNSDILDKDCGEKYLMVSENDHSIFMDHFAHINETNNSLPVLSDESDIDEAESIIEEEEEHIENHIPNKRRRKNSDELEDGDSRPKSKRKSSKSGGKERLKWTPHMDKLLKEGVEKFTPHGVGMWKKVAEYIVMNLLSTTGENIKISNHQCGERYKHHLDPTLDGRKTGPWTEAEIEALTKLVPEHTSNGLDGTKKPLINWVKIAILLNRHYRDCQHKWINLTKSTLKTGVFTKEEEELILRRVEEWGDKGRGIWVQLEKEIGRRNRSILDKYKRLTKKKV